MVFPPDKVTAKVPVKEVNPAVLMVKLLELKPVIVLAEMMGHVYVLAGLKLATDKETKVKVMGDAEQVTAPVAVILSQPVAEPAVPVASFISIL